MPKYVCVAAHISIDELENRYRKATDSVERSHFQIIWLLAQGKRVREVSEVTGYCANWIRILARRYHQEGPLALADQRQHHREATPLLSKDQQEQLQHALEETSPDGGLWTGRKRRKHTAVSPFKTIRPVSVTPRSSDFRPTSFS